MLRKEGQLPAGFKTHGRVAAIGDVHGRLDALKAAVEAVENPAETEMVMLGDYVHRGPDSRGVLKYLNDLENKHPFRSLVLLPGNHDHMLLEAARDPRGDAANDWVFNQNYLTTMNEYPDLPTGQAVEHLALSLPEQVIRRLSGDIPFWHKSGDVLFIHAGVHPRGTVAQNFTKEVRYPVLSMWVREDFLGDFGPHCGPDGEHVFVVHGHTKIPARDPALFMEMCLHGVDHHRMDLDISHTDGMLLLEAEGTDFRVSNVLPTPAPDARIGLE